MYINASAIFWYQIILVCDCCKTDSFAIVGTWSPKQFNLDLFGFANNRDSHNAVHNMKAYHTIKAKFYASLNVQIDFSFLFIHKLTIEMEYSRAVSRSFIQFGRWVIRTSSPVDIDTQQEKTRRIAQNSWKQCIVTLYFEYCFKLELIQVYLMLVTIPALFKSQVKCSMVHEISNTKFSCTKTHLNNFSNFFLWNILDFFLYFIYYSRFTTKT